MRILQLTPRIAWPPTDGGRVVMLQVAQSLHHLGAEVEVLSLNPRKQRVDVAEGRAALAPVPLDAIDINTSAHAMAFLRSLMLGAPQLVARFYSPRFERVLRRRLRHRAFDVVQIESPFLLPYVKTIRESSRALVVLRSLNVEFRIWERLAANARTALRRAALTFVANGLRRYELANLNTCDAIVPISGVDAADYRALGATVPIHVLPGAVELHEIAAGAGNGVGFLGSLDYRPNQDAALWIAEELRPRLRDVEMHIGGSNAPEWLRARLAASGVVFHGRVASATDFLDSMRVLIAPIFSGGGMRIKILEAMAAGKPVVATTIGAEGMDVTPGANIIIADDIDSFATAVESLLRDPARADAIGAAGKSLVAARYSAEGLTRGLLAFYEELAQSRNVGNRD